MNFYDTIAAVSTPRGKGGVALIRLSGDQAFSVADAVFFPKNGKPLSTIQPQKMVYGSIYQTDPLGNRSLLDDGMAVRFPAPHSFTGEDTVEITCHGGVLITSRVLSAVLAAGARHAEAGEFTRRAFLSGKMNLSETEALGRLLEAQNDNQLSLARSGMQGVLTDRSSQLYDRLRALLGSIYARIDFPDEDLGDMSREEMLSFIGQILDDIRALASTYRTGHAVQEGIRTVLCGRTNAGKSSIYNRLAGYDAAIVTDVEGTTRDLLRETVSVGKTTLRLCDTAGIRQTEDTVESIGIRRSLDAMEDAELILAVFDASRPLSEEDSDLISHLSQCHAPVIALLNKTDASMQDTAPMLSRYFEHVLPLSAKTGEGFEDLAKAIDSLFLDPFIDLSQDAIVANARQYAALLRASDALADSKQAMESGLPLDLCCVDIEVAMSALSELEGRQVGEEIVAEIFSKFCVGK